MPETPPAISTQGAGSDEQPQPERILLLGLDRAVLEQARLAIGTAAAVVDAADAPSGRARLEQESPDVVVVDATAAGELLPAISQQDYPPPVIVLGAAEPPLDVFARVSTPAELAPWIAAGLRYRRLQLETKLVREESERIHTGLLTSYGAVSEHSHQLEEEVKRRTEELRHYAQDLERLVEERTEALQKSNAQLVQQEKMAALGALVAGIAHDMHTPIGTITSNSDVLVRSLARLKDIVASEGCPESFRNNPDLKRVLGIVEEISRVSQLACDRIIGIVRSLRNFARLDEADVKAVDLREGIESTLTLVHHELKNRITIKREYGEIPLVQCHPNQINQVFMNLLVNASHAIPEKGTITIRTFREGDMVAVQISDTGTGIKPEHLERIFDPGFTTKGAGVGTGLGLAICYKIIQDHKGKLDVESEVGKGTTFTIRLPVEWKTSLKATNDAAA